MAGAATGIEQQLAQAVEGAGRVGGRGLQRLDHESLCCFGQIRVGEEIRRGRQGRGQAEGFRADEGGERDDAADAAPGAADAPGEGVGNGVLRRRSSDEGEEAVHVAGPRPAAKLAGGGAGTAIFLGQVLPGAGGTGDPEDGVEGAAEIGGAAASARGGGCGEVGGEVGEFGVGQGVEGVGAHNGLLSDNFPNFNAYMPSDPTHSSLPSPSNVDLVPHRIHDLWISNSIHNTPSLLLRFHYQSDIFHSYHIVNSRSSRTGLLI